MCDTVFIVIANIIVFGHSSCEVWTSLTIGANALSTVSVGMTLTTFCLGRDDVDNFQIDVGSVWGICLDDDVCAA